MPVRGLLSLFALCLCALFIGPYRALASGRRSVGLNPGPATAPTPAEGICAAAAVHGYGCQEFDVTTEDGYILSLQRIPEGRTGGTTAKLKTKQPVLLQHGVLVDGLTWLLNPPEQSLALILADSGFDVWIANTRGTRFSSRHLTLNPKKPEFWDWTWDDLVAYELPAVINFVFKQTGQKIDYVGHSQGTLTALASFSEGKQVDKVKAAALLSPIAYLSHMTTALGSAAAKTFVGEMTRVFGLAEFNPNGKPVSDLLKALCIQPGVDCYDLLTEITGKNCCLNSSTVDLFLKNEPQPTATKNMVHLAQTVRRGILSKYDYGNVNSNLKHYGQARPPVYNLTNIPRDLPLFLSYGGRDALSDVKDVETLLDSLKLHDPDKLGVRYIRNYAHADFIMGVTAKDIVYNQVVAFFKSHQ
ncbi:Triacylglycerol lipase [Bertholletia excelsa]